MKTSILQSDRRQKQSSLFQRVVWELQHHAHRSHAKAHYPLTQSAAIPIRARERGIPPVTYNTRLAIVKAIHRYRETAVDVIAARKPKLSASVTPFNIRAVVCFFFFARDAPAVQLSKMPWRIKANDLIKRLVNKRNRTHAPAWLVCFNGPSVLRGDISANAFLQIDFRLIALLLRLISAASQLMKAVTLFCFASIVIKSKLSCVLVNSFFFSLSGVSTRKLSDLRGKNRGNNFVAVVRMERKENYEVERISELILIGSDMINRHEYRLDIAVARTVQEVIFQYRWLNWMKIHDHLSLDL